MVILKILLGLVTLTIGIMASFVAIGLLFLVSELIDVLIDRLKKHKPFKIFASIVSWLFKITLGVIGIAFVILMAYGIGDKIF